MAAAKGRDGYLLWGTHHDSAGQLEAFRRLVGPLGIGGLTVVALENFDARGGWKGIDAKIQVGDSELLARWLEKGESRDLQRIREKHERKSYALWKYGNLSALMDIAVAARATGLPVTGCDMPITLQQRTREASESAMMRLRELHCALAVERHLARRGAPRRVAMLWGRVESRSRVRGAWPGSLLGTLPEAGQRDLAVAPLPQPPLGSEGNAVSSSRPCRRPGRRG